MTELEYEDALKRIEELLDMEPDVYMLEFAEIEALCNAVEEYEDGMVE